MMERSFEGWSCYVCVLELACQLSCTIACMRENVFT